MSASPDKLGTKKVDTKTFHDREDKTAEALSTFTELEDCKYANKWLGNPKNNDFMECDCFEEYSEGINHACDENSDCINRLTLIECVNGQCGSCGEDCQNQVFQKKQYANIAVFQTDKKGYGVRAEADIEANQFIYEYKGEVIEEEEFRDRLIDYDEKGLKHFYFMMLQMNEFIDATVKGSLARFCNHSCNPNAYVNKWVVAGKLRMGIFAKRAIKNGEEITFDYNVDRYGATAQKCYCGEPNCIGFLGGKTQTDSASLLPNQFADALGITTYDEKKWIKEMKSKGLKIEKSKDENINIDFVESIEISPCEKTEDVTKVMSVLLQIDNELIAEKLLQRIFAIDDESLLHQVIKFHGYSCFAKLLNFFPDDSEHCTEILKFLLRLPKTTKNAILSCGIDKQIEEFENSSKENAKLVKELKTKWSTFEMYSRIGKREINSGTLKLNKLRRTRLPPGWELIFENGHPMYFNAQLRTKLRSPPSGSTETFSRSNSSTSLKGSAKTSKASSPALGKRPRMSDEDFLKMKKQRQEKEQLLLEKAKEEEKRKLIEKFEQETQRKDELAKIIERANKQMEEEKEALKQQLKEEEKRRKEKKHQSSIGYMESKWNKFFAGIVPNLLKKYEATYKIEHDHIKNCARDMVKTLTSKELKKGNKNPPSELTKEKQTKIKQFSKIYMEKFLVKYNKKKEAKAITN